MIKGRRGGEKRRIRDVNKGNSKEGEKSRRENYGERMNWL